MDDFWRAHALRDSEYLNFFAFTVGQDRGNYGFRLYVDSSAYGATVMILFGRFPVLWRPGLSIHDVDEAEWLEAGARDPALMPEIYLEVAELVTQLRELRPDLTLNRRTKAYACYYIDHKLGTRQ